MVPLTFDVFFECTAATVATVGWWWDIVLGSEASSLFAVVAVELEGVVVVIITGLEANFTCLELDTVCLRCTLASTSLRAAIQT